MFSAQPPTLAVLLSGPYWVMRALGLTFATNPSLVEYLLTMLGVTLPVALAAGFVHHMGRLFELADPSAAAGNGRCARQWADQLRRRARIRMRPPPP